MKSHHKMIIIFLLYCIFLLFAHHPVYYQILVQLMRDWNWLLSGLSAGAFAAAFSWIVESLKERKQKKAYSQFVAVEIYNNYNEIYLRLCNFEKLTTEPFITHTAWEKSREKLTTLYPTEIIMNIDSLYQKFDEFEIIATSSNAEDKVGYTFSYQESKDEMTTLARKVFSFMQTESGLKNLSLPDLNRRQTDSPKSP